MVHHSTRHKATPHWHISGSSRLRMDVPTHLFTPDAHTSLTETTRELGHKQYEISNHLGNVLSVITDQKLPVEVGSLIVSYSAVVVTATNYSPFGVGLYGRSWSGEYRFGFQGQEEDPESKSQVTFKNRIQDCRIGRFLSIDPLVANFPWNSPFAFSENRVLDAIELEGREALRIHSITNLKDGQILIKIIPDETVENNASSPFRFRIPAGVIPGIDTEMIFTPDDAGTPNFGLRGLQAQFAGFRKVQDRLFLGIVPFDNVDGSSFGVETFSTPTPGANLKDFIKGAVVSDLVFNDLVTVEVPVSEEFNIGMSGDFSGPDATQRFTFTTPTSSTDVRYNLNYDDRGVPNTFTFTDELGNVLGGGTVGPGSGSISFSARSGSTVTMSVTGAPSSGTGDEFTVTGTQTTTNSITVIAP